MPLLRTGCRGLSRLASLYPDTTLLNSGSTANLISKDLQPVCNRLGLRKTLNEMEYTLQSITGGPIGWGRIQHRVGPLQLQVRHFHHEEIVLLVLEGSTAEIVLGCPWLVVHGPTIAWATGEIQRWSDTCFPRCFPSLPSPGAQGSTCPS